ncbi:1-phosphofructokinase [Halorubrum sp. N11]|uniref:1-phosphofructokinase n=1 Tax=Halorubrum sp. N11 TaxID=3402276 RepID=UPI003EBBF05C
MILTVTLNPAVDHTINVDGELDPERVNRGNVARYDAGGKGINVSKYLTGLGAETVATGIVGGLFGEYVARQLSRTKTPHDFVEMSGCTRLNTTILTDDKEYKINQSGNGVTRQTTQAVIDTVREYDPEVVVVAGSLPPGVGPATIDRIADAGDWDTAVDVGGHLLERLRVDCALAKPNQQELATATGMETDTVEDCIAAANALRETGFERVVASLGADGAVLSTAAETFYVPAVGVEVVDTAGAGDAMLAGIVHALTRGFSDERALQYGTAVAGRSVTVPGTSAPDLSGMDEVARDLHVRSG